MDCATDAERQQLCERVFQGGEEELGLLEALKLLMLSRAAELHSCMQGGEDVPLFCWLLFARDSSDCPRSFLSNHLSHVGLTAGLEQVGSVSVVFDNFMVKGCWEFSFPLSKHLSHSVTKTTIQAEHHEVGVLTFLSCESRIVKHAGACSVLFSACFE